MDFQVLPRRRKFEKISLSPFGVFFMIGGSIYVLLNFIYAIFIDLGLEA